MIQFTAEEHAVAPFIAREDFYFFVKWMFAHRRGYKWRAAPHHKLICDALTRVYKGTCKRLILNLPPRYSKTELVQNWIAWTLGHVPDSEYIYASYSGALATKNTWKTKDIVTHPEYLRIFPRATLRADSQARNDWATDAGGSVYASGTEGTITGYGAGKMREGFGGAAIIDDPTKPTEARSELILNNCIEWYQDTFESRRNSPETPTVIIMQRLAEDDLSGWLIDGGSGEEWEVISLPALCDSEDDPLGREIGEALWPDKHDEDKLREMQIAKPYVFSGQYQQKPSPAEGNIFKPDNIATIDAVPAGRIMWCRGWDFASTMKGDFTAGALIGRHENGRYIVADMVRMQSLPDERDRILKNTTQADGHGVQVSIPQDPGQAGKTQVLDLAKKLAGYRLKFTPESGPKETRAEPFASQVNVGNVDMVRGSWNKAFVEELRGFPNMKFDDQVDAASRAFAEVNGNAGMKISPELLRSMR